MVRSEKLEATPLGFSGIEFLEFASPESEKLAGALAKLGFGEVGRHKKDRIRHLAQGDIHVLINSTPDTFASRFHDAHGPSVSSIGLRIKDANGAMELARKGRATICSDGDYHDESGRPIPAIFGLGDSLIYLIDTYPVGACYREMGFQDLPKSSALPPGPGFIAVDHLSQSVLQGTTETWASFYKGVFGFNEVRYFDIKGKKTGLTSLALRSPCGKFCISLNEGKEEKSQTNQYLKAHRGPGVQHIAFLTADIVKSVDALRRANVPFLDVDPQYYQGSFSRVPPIAEDRRELEKRSILVDGDDEGYLLQAFTRELSGPIFFEIIERKNYRAFGQGNFTALFRAIEIEQERRGTL